MIREKSKLFKTYTNKNIMAINRPLSFGLEYLSEMFTFFEAQIFLIFSAMIENDRKIKKIRYRYIGKKQQHNSNVLIR